MNIEEMIAATFTLPAGDYAECGVWQGRTAKMIHDAIGEQGYLFLIDSFEGHADPSEFDDPINHPRGRYADTSIERVRMEAPRAIIIKSFIDLDLRSHIPLAFDELTTRRFRFVHIDLDHYLPTKAACMFFAPRMVPGGIIRFDDYGHIETPGATKAIDEIFGPNIEEGDWRWTAPLDNLAAKSAH